MAKNSLNEFFENFLKKESIFKDKYVLQSTYTPDHILYRDEQTKQVANILAPALKLEKPSNLFIYGKTGTGKTLLTNHITKNIAEISASKGIPLKIIYINCKLKRVADTEYRLIAQVAREFGKTIPSTGLPTEEIYNIFFTTLDKEKLLVLLVLDEIDQIVKKTSNEILYNLTRINTELKHSQLSLIGISNDMMFADNLDPRVKSSLSEEEVLFPPYNALQIQHLLKKRAKKAFKKGVIKEGAIEKCAAYAAREHGDARRALELLRIAGEITEREEKNRVGIEQVDAAEEKIERDKITDIILTQPKQFQATLYAAMFTTPQKHKPIFTGEVYEFYKDMCKKINLRPLTQRRISDIIAELDMLGILNAKTISKGRYGRTREISLAIPGSLRLKVKKILTTTLGI